MADSLRARLRDALVGLKFGLGTNARYGLSGREVEEATEQLLPMVQAELDRLAAERDDWRTAAYQASRERDEARSTVERVRQLAEKWQREEGPLHAKAVVQAASARLYRALTEPTTEENPS